MNAQTQIFATHILTTKNVVLSAWEPTAGITGPHSTIRFEDGRPLGKITSRDLPAEIESLPVGLARSEACHLRRKVLEAEALYAIRRANGPHLDSFLWIATWAEDGDRVLVFNSRDEARDFAKAFGSPVVEAAS